MARRYSVADARKHLPELLDQVEEGRTIEITRRGQPVAVVLSVAEYRRTRPKPDAFRRALRSWQSSWTDADRAVPDDFFDSLRDRGTGRDVDL